MPAPQRALKSSSVEWFSCVITDLYADILCSDSFADRDAFQSFVQESIKQEDGFAKTLKKLERLQVAKRKRSEGVMETVVGGVVELHPYGSADAALELDGGKRVVVTGWRTDRPDDDIQTTTGVEANSFLSSDQLLDILAHSQGEISPHLICQAEVTHFKPAQRDEVLALLWKYITSHGRSTNHEELIATGAAIRKYIAMMPMDRINDLAVLLESDKQESVSFDLEIEVMKMIFRNFEVHPPLELNQHSSLAIRLWKKLEVYINPEIILRDKFAALAAITTEALVSMRSEYAERAWSAVKSCPHGWFRELVQDDLNRLKEKWSSKGSIVAAQWLEGILLR